VSFVGLPHSVPTLSTARPVVTIAVSNSNIPVVIPPSMMPRRLISILSSYYSLITLQFHQCLSRLRPLVHAGAKLLFLLNPL
jgi:hypothetical protein